MKLKDYESNAVRTLPNLGNSQMDTIHMLMGLTTEVGELMDAHKREFAYNKKIDPINIKEEIGDIMWYLVNYCTINNIDLEECFDKNIRKLLKRFPNNFNQNDAVIRNLQEERNELEK